MATLGITYGELKANIAMILGISRDSADWSTETAADVDRIIRAGRRRFVSAHDWDFLKEYHDFQVEAPYSTGTITIAAGVVTLTGGTFPTSAANQMLSVAGKLYRINTRDSNTQVTLQDTSVAVTAATTYAVYVIRYALPATFSEFIDPPTVEGGHVSELRETLVLPEYEIRRLLSVDSVYTARPQLFSVFHSQDADDYGIPTYYLELYPLPDKAYTVRSLVRVNIDDATGASDGDTICHPTFSAALQAATLAQAEVLYNNNAQGPQAIEAAQLLAEAINKDKRAAGARRLLPRRDSLRDYTDPYYQLRVAPINIQ